MKFKTILITVIFGILGISFYSALASIIGPCFNTVEYSIGNFDSKFGLDKELFIRDILAAEAVWETPAKKQLFKYVADADFKINLIYDERQKAVDLKRKTEFGLDGAEANFKNLDTQFSKLKSEYEARVVNHEKGIQAFKEKSDQYEKDVQYWNSQGGAPEAEYRRLQNSRESLNNMTNALNAEAQTINNLSANLNLVLDSRNAAAKDYNKVVENYNKQFGSGLEFDQAEYTGSEINVYEFKDHKDLTLALAHELGHAIGMDHVETSASVMYYMTGDQTLSPTPEDLAELKRSCRIK